MAVTFTQNSTVSARLTGLLYGVLMSAIALASMPGFESISAPARVRPPTAAFAKPEPSPVVHATKPVGPDKSAISAYLAREWKLGRDYAGQVATAIVSAAHRHRVDPLLLLAVAAAESSLQHSVGNPGGGTDPMKPYGIMQVAGQYHTDKFPGGVVRRTSVVENVDIGAQVLQEYLDQERGNERRALLRYNGSLNGSDKYYRRVRTLKNRLVKELSTFEQARSAEQSA